MILNRDRPDHCTSCDNRSGWYSLTNMISHHSRNGSRSALATSPWLLLFTAGMTMAVTACAAGGTSEPETPPTSEAPAQAEAKEPTEAGQAQRLVAGGCALLLGEPLAGDWQIVEGDGSEETTWELRGEGPVRTLILHPVVIDNKSPLDEWRLDVGALLNMRREAHQQESEQPLDLSEIEYLPPPAYPGAFYSERYAESGDGTITINRMSRTLECVVFLGEVQGDHQAMAALAWPLLRSLELDGKTGTYE